MNKYRLYWAKESKEAIGVKTLMFLVWPFAAWIYALKKQIQDLHFYILLIQSVGLLAFFRNRFNTKV